MTVPTIDALTRRLSECPQDFLAEPMSKGKPEGTNVAAVVADLLEDLGTPLGEGVTAGEVAGWNATGVADRNWLRLVLVTCWLCHDGWLREEARHAVKVKGFLQRGLRPLAGLVAADLFVTDPDRREELARALLAALGLRPAGENEAQASDRLRSLSSVERAKVVAETKAQAERARKLREKMEAEAARQAAARYSSE